MRRPWSAGVVWSFGALALLSASVASAQHNMTRIVVPASGMAGNSGPARVYPSPINVGPLPAVHSVTVILHNVVHPCLEALDVLLEGPDGTSVILMSDVGGCAGLLSPKTITFSDNGWVAGQVDIPDGSTLHPSNAGAWPDYFPPPANSAATGADLSVFRGKSAGGTWRLYVVDDQGGHRGEIQGWTLALRHYRDFGAGYVTVNVPATGQTMGVADVYPLTATDTQIQGRVEAVEATVQFAKLEDPDDIDLLLVGPTGERALLMSDAGGYADVAFPGFDITFSDAAMQSLADNGPLAAGNWKPTNYGSGDTFPAPAPGGYSSALAIFRGTNPNGTWSLYAYDDTQAGVGLITGFSLRVVTVTPEGPPVFVQLQPYAITTTSPFVHLGANVIVPAGVVMTWRNGANGTTGVGHAPASGGAFGVTVPVVAGDNVITLTTTNAAGEQSSQVVTVTANTFSYTFAEGATGTFFDLDLALFNPASSSAPVDVTFLTPTASYGPKAYTLGARGRLRIPVESLVSQYPGLAAEAVSTVISSKNAVALGAERTMFWDAARYGGHSASAVAEPSTSWYFAEGSQGFFDTFVLLANPNGSNAQATVSFLLESGPPLVQVYTVKAGTRLTIWTATMPQLKDRSFGITVSATLPITAERAMYFSGAGGRPFEGGHESAGVTRPSSEWHFAEGATGPYFDTYILVSNPSAANVPVTFTYRTSKGQVVQKTKLAAPMSRLTVNVELEDGLLADAAVSTTVSAPEAIVAERAMYWPGAPSTWFEAHNSVGMPETADRWAVADARVGGPEAFETFLLVVNPEEVDAHVLVSFARSGLASPIHKLVVVPANSRITLTATYDAPQVLDPSGSTEYSVTFETVDLTRIAVERATYWWSGGVPWSGGASATATRLR